MTTQAHARIAADLGWVLVKSARVEQFHLQGEHDQQSHAGGRGTAEVYNTPDGLKPPTARQREYDPESGLEPGQGLGSAARDHYISEFGYRDFNQPLRLGATGEGAALHANRFMIDELTAEIDESPGFVQPVTLYRGLDGGLLGDVEVGTVVTDPAFMSTSTSGYIADGFAEIAQSEQTSRNMAPQTVLKITAPPGTKAVRGRLDEDEWIVQRGSSLIITGITRDQGVRGRTVVEIEAELRQE